MVIREPLPNLVLPLLDPGIPTLSAIFDAAGLRASLEDIEPPKDWRPVQDIRIQVLKHHPGRRCTFEIALRTAAGWRELIGKVYAKDRSDINAAMQRIAGACFGPETEFSIPTPIALVPGLCLVLQEKIQGPRAKDFFLTG